jgi:hypothetical protein
VKLLHKEMKELGETVSQNKKYHLWNGVSGYYDKPRVFHNSYLTESISSSLPASGSAGISLSHANSYDELLRQTVKINAWQRDRNRSQVVRKDVEIADKEIRKRK